MNGAAAKTGSKGAVLLMAALTSFLTPFMASSVNISLPQIGRQFSMSAVMLSWMATAYLLAAAMFLVPFGRLADIYGRKRIFLAGMALFALASLSCGLSVCPAMLLASRALQGIGVSMTFGTSVALLISIYPPAERGKALGLNVAAVYAGLSLGPLLGGFLTQHFGWRSVFYASLPASAAVILLAFAAIGKEDADGRGEKFDLPGAVLYGASLAGLMYGLSILPRALGIGLALAGAAGLAAFTAWEARAPAPVLDMKLFRGNAVFGFSNLAALLHYSATYAITFLISLYLQYIKGMSPQSAGMVLVIQPVLMALASPFAGKLSDRVEPRVVASTGMGLTAAGIFMLVFLGPDAKTAFILAALAVIGVGYGLFTSPNTNAVMSSVEKRYYGVASGTVGTMRLVGQVTSQGIVTMAFALHIGAAKITAETSPLFLKTIPTLFVIFTCLCAAGVLASLARGNVRSLSEK